MKAVMCETVTSVRQELEMLRDRTSDDKSGLSEMTERVREALSLYSHKCDHRLREREQELTVDHELEMADLKKLIQSREEEICTLKSNLLEMETDLAEHDRLMTTMRQKLESEETKMGKLQTILHRQLEEALEQARVEKEAAVKKVNEERFMAIASLTNSLTQYQKLIEEFEDSRSTARIDQQMLMKYVTKMHTIGSQFNLNASAAIERSPSDSSLEKIEVRIRHLPVSRPLSINVSMTTSSSVFQRPDVIEPAILAQTKEDIKLEKTTGNRTAIDNERADCLVKLNHELRLATQAAEKKEEQVEMYRMKARVLNEDWKRYKNTIRRMTKSENSKSILAEAGLCKEDSDERLEMSQSSLEEVLKSLEPEKDEVEVSESKKVRLEANNDPSCLSRRLEILENENKRLNAELQLLRESKESAEAKIEALEADKVRLEIELVSNRSGRNFAVPECSSSADSHEKEMNASVAVVAESGSSRAAATIPTLNRRCSCMMCCYSVSNVEKKMKKIAAKLVQQGRITVNNCGRGDIVLVFWDPTHGNYTIYQESATLYFLSSDCIAAFDLSLNPDGTPKSIPIIAEVVDKEFCHARKVSFAFPLCLLPALDLSRSLRILQPGV